MRPLLWVLSSLVSIPILAPPAWPQAFPINSDVALQPAEDQWIYRTQLRFRQFESDNLDPQTEVDLLINSHVLVYGFTSRDSVLLAAPILYRDTEWGDGGDRENLGIGDPLFLVRHQVWKDLGYLKSESFTVFAGLEIPSYDDPFSSRSWDPILGAAYSWRQDRRGYDIDFIYQLNTENDRGFEPGDVLQYDVALQYRLCPVEYTKDTEWTLSALLEINGEYQRDSKMRGRTLGETDSHQILISPGLVWAGKRTRFGIGAQIPVYQSVGDLALEDKIGLVVGYTYTF